MKNILYPALSALTQLIPRRLRQRYFASLTPVFMMHRLVYEDREKQVAIQNHLDWVLRYIKKHKYCPITLNQLVNHLINDTPVPEKTVVFTFDDGFYDQYEVARPLFNRYEIPYTCFVITEFINGRLWPWDDQVKYVLENTKKLSEKVYLPDKSQYLVQLPLKISNRKNAIDALRDCLKLCDQSSLYQWLHSFYKAFDVDVPDCIPKQYKPMSWHQAQSLINDGHDVAAHTMTHRILSQLSDQEALVEIEGSLKEVNQQLVGVKSLFAYPTGRRQDFGQREIDILASIGIKGAVTTLSDYASPSSTVLAIPRFSLPSTRFDTIQCLSFIEHLKSNFKKRY